VLIPLAEVVAAGVTPGPTIHVGAHLGEEAAQYERYGFSPVFWIEANYEKLWHLKRNVESLGGVVIGALVSDKPGPRTFHLASNGQSSSYYELGTHATEHPDVTYVGERTLEATTLDELASAGRLGAATTFLSMDVQGAELDVLRGGEGVLSGVRACYLEVNSNDVYRGCAQEPEVTAWLAERGFRKVLEKMTLHGWGDAVFVR
jgi:FkbM family methyltransferase